MAKEKALSENENKKKKKRYFGKNRYYSKKKKNTEKEETVQSQQELRDEIHEIIGNINHSNSYSSHKNGSAKKHNHSKNGKAPTVKIAFLGGINEVGKNMTLYEFNDEMIIVDCGLAFPDPDLPGVDLVIPDFTYVMRNIHKVKAMFITHGHEDHIGGLPYLLGSCNIPVYATKLTMGLIRYKLKEQNLLQGAKLHEIKAGDINQIGPFNIEAIHVNHSIPDAVAFAIKTNAGTIIQTGDFKIDSTPIDGGMMDLARFAQLGNEGVLALLADSTNAERPGFTESESIVGESFETLFRRAGKHRIIVATFASNIHRVQQIINVAASLKRKVALVGRSLENVVSISNDLGYINIPDNVLIKSDNIKQYTPEQLVIITTGSQGEPMSALTRMAFSDHKKVEIVPGDFVIISATPIPGNEKTVGNVVNELMKLGAEVIYEKMYDVHVSGHACQEELKLMMGLIKPQYFIPVHGEQKHLQKHAALASTLGYDNKHIFIADNGHVAQINKNQITSGALVPAGKVYVDGSGVGDVGNVVIRDRKILGEDGIIVVAASIDYKTGQLIAGPEIESRGFVYVKDSEDLISDMQKNAERAIEDCYYSDIKDINAIKGKVKDSVSKFVRSRTKREPTVMPIIMEV